MACTRKCTNPALNLFGLKNKQAFMWSAGTINQSMNKQPKGHVLNTANPSALFVGCK